MIAHSKRLRHKIRNAQRNRCAVCGAIFGSVQVTLEHVIPRSRGGGNMGNLLVSHLHCNQRRGNQMPTGCMMIWLDAVNVRIAA